MNGDDVRESLKLPLNASRSNTSSPSDSPRDFPLRSPSSESQLIRAPSSPNMQRALALSLGNSRKSISNGSSPAVPKFSTVQARRNGKRSAIPNDQQWHSDEPSVASYSSDSPRSGEESPRKHSPRSDNGSSRPNGILLKPASPSSSPPGLGHKIPPRPPPRLSVSGPIDAQAIPAPLAGTAKQTSAVQGQSPRGCENSVLSSSPKSSGEFLSRPTPPSAQRSLMSHDGPMATPPMHQHPVSVGPNVAPPQPPLKVPSKEGVKRPVQPLNHSGGPAATDNNSPRGFSPKLVRICTSPLLSQ